MHPIVNLAILRERLTDIDKRLAELSAFKPRERGNNPPTFAEQEAVAERSELACLRVDTERRIYQLESTPTKPTPEREAFIAAEMENRRRLITANVERLEREGDYRQARVWRGELLKIREQIEVEFPA